MDYSFIADLSDGWEKLALPELKGLAGVWKEQQQKLDSQALGRFIEKLARQFSIETGLLENLYSLDRGTTELLIEHGLVSSLIPDGGRRQSPVEVAAILNDHRSALQGLFDFVGDTRELSTSYIKTLHAELTRHQTSVYGFTSTGKKVSIELKRGDYKVTPNNPTRPDGSIHIYAPPEHVSSEMDRLVELHLEHQKRQVPPEVEAAWLHHRFTQIHPFQDGNGRVARCLANLVFIKAGWLLDTHQTAQERFNDWLEFVIAAGLEEWRRSL